MKQNNFGELVYTEDDVCDLVMKGHTPADLAGMIVDSSVELKYLNELLDPAPTWSKEETRGITPEQFHAQQQATWHMPEQYRNMDIAAHVLGLCNTEAELQRCGKELLLYQERDLFNLLRFMVYMVDVMTEHKIIWGVGRGSSVASYVLYKLKVHKIDSMYYNLDVEEFLR
jgi:DNA polymerase III alpha subunit